VISYPENNRFAPATNNQHDEMMADLGGPKFQIATNEQVLHSWGAKSTETLFNVPGIQSISRAEWLKQKEKEDRAEMTLLKAKWRRQNQMQTVDVESGKGKGKAAGNGLKRYNAS
jgi:hypothetical protein